MVFLTGPRKKNAYSAPAPGPNAGDPEGWVPGYHNSVCNSRLKFFQKKFPRAPCQPLQNLPIREKSSPKNFRKLEKNVSLFSGGIDR